MTDIAVNKVLLQKYHLKFQITIMIRWWYSVSAQLVLSIIMSGLVSSYLIKSVFNRRNLQVLWHLWFKWRLIFQLQTILMGTENDCTLSGEREREREEKTCLQPFLLEWFILGAIYAEIKNLLVLLQNEAELENNWFAAVGVCIYKGIIHGVYHILT